MKSSFEPIGLSSLYDMRISDVQEIYECYMKLNDEEEKTNFIDNLDQYEFTELTRLISRKERDSVKKDLEIMNSNPTWAKGLIAYSLFSQKTHQDKINNKKISCVPNCCILL